MGDVHLIKLLDALIQALKVEQLWSDAKPSKSALLSDAPFCCDTLTFAQWLQFIFEPKMRRIADHGDPLPQMALMPMSELTYGGRYPLLDTVITKLDAYSKNAQR